jgi:hypothetical protein
MQEGEIEFPQPMPEFLNLPHLKSEKVIFMNEEYKNNIEECIKLFNKKNINCNEKNIRYISSKYQIQTEEILYDYFFIDMYGVKIKNGKIFEFYKSNFLKDGKLYHGVQCDILSEEPLVYYDAVIDDNNVKRYNKYSFLDDKYIGASIHNKIPRKERNKFVSKDNYTIKNIISNSNSYVVDENENPTGAISIIRKWK